MESKILDTLNFTKPDEPQPTDDLRTLLLGWLAFQRRTFLRKLPNLDAERIAAMSVPPLELSILGLVRHMTQMEHAHLAWGLGGGERVIAYGDDDFAGGAEATLDDDVARYLEEVARSDRAIAAIPALDARGDGHSWPLGATLVKMVQEYALHNGQGHMLRHAAPGEVIR